MTHLLLAVIPLGRVLIGAGFSRSSQKKLSLDFVPSTLFFIHWPGLELALARNSSIATDKARPI